MHKVWAVIRREFIERVRSKWFLISTVLGPLFMIALAVLPSVLATRTGRVSRMVIVDEGAGSLAPRIETQLRRSGRFSVSMLPAAEGRDSILKDSLTGAVQREELDGFLYLAAATLEAGQAEYRGRNVSSLRDMALLESVVRQSVVVERLNRRGVDPSLVQEAQSRIDLRTLRISRRGGAGESGEATFFLGYTIGIVLYMVILLYGMNVMRSVLQEKQDRIVEVLVSSLKPFQLMAGKVAGVGSVGLFQFSIWSLTAYALFHWRRQVLSLFGVNAQAVDAVRLPALGADLLLLVGVYFLLGYLLYSALFAVVGSSVNSDSEAQQAQQPVMMLLVFSLIGTFSALGDPGGRLAEVLSLVPLSAPIIMPVRVATSDVPFPQLLLSLSILAATVLLVVWLSARIYRIGILMYGKRPNLKELWRWARQS